MLLRASGEREGFDANLNAVTDTALDSGVPHSDLLRQLTEHCIGRNWAALASVRDTAIAQMGEQASTDALTVAAAFNGITRVADATGIPLDDTTHSQTGPMRATTGIDEFAYSNKSARFSH